MVDRHRCTLAGGFSKQNNSFYMERYMFRGKRKDNSEWVYGYYISSPEFPFNDCKHFITEFIGIESGEPIFAWIEVIPETVGQFTGLKDKNGNEIYEGDIVLWDGRKAVIEWLPRMAGYYAMWKGEGVHFHDMQQIVPSNGGLRHIEIIGNIHDNPELLTPLKGERINTMHTDPAAKQEATNEQVTDLESAAQDQAMEVDSEEGTTEG